MENNELTDDELKSVEYVVKRIEEALAPYIGKAEVNADFIDKVTEIVTSVLPKPEFSVSVRENAVIAGRITIDVIPQNMLEISLTI